jgi:uncharacterized protein YdeI (YjbR/CyaY-like superfamily)
MPKTDPRVDAYIAKSADFARPILKRLRKVVHAGCPDVEETIKWSVPAFEYKGILAGMAAFKAYCALVLWKGAFLKDHGLSAADAAAMEKAGRLTSLDDLPPDATLVKLIQVAADVNAKGLKAPRRPKQPPKPIRVPSFLAAALKKNRKAQAAFQALSPSHKREYIEWLTDAKTEPTRLRRLHQAPIWIVEGKSRNWNTQRAWCPASAGLAPVRLKAGTTAPSPARLDRTARTAARCPPRRSSCARARRPPRRSAS